MKTAQIESVEGTVVRSPFDALAYDAPFLIEKLVKDRIVETPEEGEVLFREVKRFCVLVCSGDRHPWEMYSLRVDEVWHQFILYTREYMEFCDRFLGGYIPHSPNNAPKSEIADWPEAPSFEVFQRRYEQLFGEPLPDAWYDEKSVTLVRRVLNDQAGTLAVREEDGMVDLLTGSGEVLLSVNELAQDALAFIARTGAFYVRELPGDLEAEEKIALIATLVECGVLRVGV